MRFKSNKRASSHGGGLTGGLQTGVPDESQTSRIKVPNERKQNKKERETKGEKAKESDLNRWLPSRSRAMIESIFSIS